MKVIILFIVLCSSSSTFAWNSAGHRLMSAIAYQHLTLASREKVDELTNILDPGYPPSDRFMYISTLPDMWKKQDQGESASWHYIDLPWSVDGTPTSPPLTPNLLTVFEKKQAMLSDSNIVPKDKATTLAYLVHLEEDAHQPLHCISRFSTAFPKGDKGGNLFKIQSTRADNLHAYWDGGIVLLNPSRQAARFTNRTLTKMAQAIQQKYGNSDLLAQSNDLVINNWINKSYTIAKQTVYNLDMGTTPTKEYNDQMRKVVAQQMILGGCRLANILNHIYY